MQISINGQLRAVPPDWQQETLLSTLRELFGLVGSKFGCGAGLCGACTVLVDGEARRSCLLAVNSLVGRSIRTIEGLAPVDGSLHPVQQAWLDVAVPQCGYCQAGQIMSAVALLERQAKPTDSQIDEALSGHLCRCGTQQRVRSAIRRASASAKGATP